MRPAQQFYERATTDMIWRVCEYIRYIEHNQHCEQCPAVEQSDDGPCTRGCYVAAQEVIAMVLEEAAASKPIAIPTNGLRP